MIKQKSRRVLFVAILTLMFGLLPLQPGRVTAQSEPSAIGHFFRETNQAISGLFWRYWVTRGALAQQGYPISPDLFEVSDTDGKSYTVQYFERAVFEFHPEFAAPNNVLLSLLGVFRYNQRYPNGAPGQVPNQTTGSVLFPETGKRVGGEFLQYWRANGGLAQQGYPISDEFDEVSPLDGRTYRVQYFERAVFEKHPENPPPFNVLLSQLGTFRYQEKYESNLRGFPGDIDGDNVADVVDRCPRSGENLNVVFDLDGCPDSMQTLLVFAAEDIDAFWRRQFAASGLLYDPPAEFVAYDGPTETPCGTADLNNAFYCGGSHGIYYHYEFLLDQLNTDGDFAPVTILAHEWGHLTQAHLGLLSGQFFTIQIELQADCFAGAWAAYAGEQGLLDEGDLEEGAVALFRAGDDFDTPWFDPDAHGQPEERVNAFATGLYGGTGACFE